MYCSCHEPINSEPECSHSQTNTNGFLITGDHLLPLWQNSFYSPPAQCHPYGVMHLVHIKLLPPSFNHYSCAMSQIQTVFYSTAKVTGNSRVYFLCSVPFLFHAICYSTSEIANGVQLEPAFERGRSPH